MRAGAVSWAIAAFAAALLVAAARAGAKVTFVGAHGRDDFGRAAKAGLKREGIDVRFFREVDAPSGVALILVGGKTRENLIAVARSANEHVSLTGVRFADYDAVVCQLEIPLAVVHAAARKARAAGIPFILNPAPARKLPAALLRLVHTLVPNEHEMMPGAQNTVITLGARGARVGRVRIPAPKVKPVDTVGAGDCFTAWLAVGIAEGLSLEAAARRLEGQVLDTPFVESQTLGQIVGARIFLKFENLQFTASFKERGACHRLSLLTPEERRRGVVAMSAGNHAQGVAYHGQRLGIPVVIVMPRHTPTVKVERTRGFGAEVVTAGETLEEAREQADALARERGLTFVHPYDDPAVIAGQGTLGLELVEAVPDLDALVISIGGDRKSTRLNSSHRT